MPGCGTREHGGLVRPAAEVSFGKSSRRSIRAPGSDSTRSDGHLVTSTRRDPPATPIRGETSPGDASSSDTSSDEDVLVQQRNCKPTRCSRRTRQCLLLHAWSAATAGGGAEERPRRKRLEIVQLRPDCTWLGWENLPRRARPTYHPTGVIMCLRR